MNNHLKEMGYGGLPAELLEMLASRANYNSRLALSQTCVNYYNNFKPTLQTKERLTLEGNELYACFVVDAVFDTLNRLRLEVDCKTNFFAKYTTTNGVLTKQYGPFKGEAVVFANQHLSEILTQYAFKRVIVNSEDFYKTLIATLPRKIEELDVTNSVNGKTIAFYFQPRVLRIIKPWWQFIIERNTDDWLDLRQHPNLQELYIDAPCKVVYEDVIRSKIKIYRSNYNPGCYTYDHINYFVEAFKQGTTRMEKLSMYFKAKPGAEFDVPVEKVDENGRVVKRGVFSALPDFMKFEISKDL